MAECRFFPECQRCNETGDSWIPCSGGADGTRCEGYEPMPDVGALLALADEMGRVRSRCGFCIKEGECDWADETICLESRVDDYAQRIREALGVES